MTSEWKKLPLLDEELVKFLRKKYPPLEYEEGINEETFTSRAIFRAGQRETINSIEYIIDLQRKGKKNN